MKLRKYYDNLRSRLDSCSIPVFIGVTIFLYITVVLTAILNHEMWRDELQTWMNVRSSPTILALYDKLVDGHPALWYFVVYVSRKFADNPVAMQFCHVVIAAGAVYVFLKYSPFSRIQKVLFIFGYFLVYEYAVISRNYAVGVFLIFCFCAVYRPGRNKHYLALSLILFLLAQTNIYGLIIAISLMLMIIFEIVADGELRASISERKWRVMLVAGLIFAAGVTIAIIAMLPTAESRFGAWHLQYSSSFLKKTIATVWKSYVPIPQIGHNFWNTNLLPGKTLPATLAVTMLLFAVFIFIRRPKILFLFCVANIGILSFIFIKYYGYMRHHGHLFVVLIVCLWLSTYYKDKQLKSDFLNNVADFATLHKNLFLNMLLTIHLIVGGYAVSMELLYPFSESKNAASFIRDNRMDNLTIVGDSDCAVSPICGYLGKGVYDPRSERFEQFIIYDKKALVDVNVQIIVERAKSVAVRSGADVLIILNYKPKTEPASIVKINEFTNSVVPDENYYLYLLKYPNTKNYVTNNEILVAPEGDLKASDSSVRQNADAFD